MLHADHEFNASTFAARVAAATLTDVHSAITGAIGALKGPLHGGANTDVMNLLLEIGQDATDQKVEEIIRAKLARKEKIPGFGHRVYRTEDPRATHLRKMSEELCTRTGNRRWFEMSQKIEQVVKAQKKLNANVDFYSATTYYALGIPVDLFTPVFAVSRMSGWTAHVLEQYANNRLIRPRAEYTGPAYPQTLRSARSTIMGSGSGFGSGQPRYDRGAAQARSLSLKPEAHSWIRSASVIFPSSRTSITASRRWPIVFSRRPGRCRPARWRRRCSTRWISSASAASPSRRIPSG